MRTPTTPLRRPPAPTAPRPTSASAPCPPTDCDPPRPLARLPPPGRIAQRESAAFTRQRSQVQNLLRPPAQTVLRFPRFPAAVSTIVSKRRSVVGIATLRDVIPAFERARGRARRTANGRAAEPRQSH